jgi:hypothetical protein
MYNIENMHMLIYAIYIVIYAIYIVIYMQYTKQYTYNIWNNVYII